MQKVVSGKREASACYGMKSETRAVGHVVSGRGRSCDAEALKKHGALRLSVREQDGQV
jgi:hypothetical protein